MVFFLFFLLPWFGYQKSEELSLQKVLTGFYQAAGGYDRVQSVRTLFLTYTGTGDSGDFRETRFHQRPNLFRRVIHYQNREVVHAFDGVDGWMTDSAASHPLPKILSESMTRPLLIEADFEGPLFNWRNKESEVRFVGPTLLDGQAALLVQILYSNGTTQELWLHEKNFLILKTANKFPDSDTVVSHFFSDYRSVDGMMLAHRIETRIGNGEIKRTNILEDVVLNPQVEPEIFELPKLIPDPK